jgi:TatD DNase family protein
VIDIGANLGHESLLHDIDGILARASAAGVGAIVVTGSCLNSNRHALDLAKAHPGMLYATAGLHPHHAAEWSAEHTAQIRTLMAAPELVSLGECGLDYFRDLSPREAQRRAFTAQLDLAVEAGKPVFLHQRDAHADFVAILREYRPHLADACVHCFTDTREALEDYLALDCHIGITGWICDERRGAGLIESVPLIPDTRLMIETDSPYLLPRNLPREMAKAAGRRNEPAFLPWVCEAVAAARGQTPEHVADTTSTTARAFFSLP